MGNNEEDDIVDEVLQYFRANVLFRNFMIEDRWSPMNTLDGVDIMPYSYQIRDDCPHLIGS